MTSPWGSPPPDDPNFPSYPPPMPPPAPYPPIAYPPDQYLQYPWGAPPSAHPQATTAMVLGIVGLACFSFLSPVAIWLGLKSMREIDASGGQLGGRGQAQAGFIMGIIGTALLCLFVVILITAMIAAISQA